MLWHHKSSIVPIQFWLMIGFDNISFLYRYIAILQGALCISSTLQYCQYWKNLYNFFKAKIYCGKIKETLPSSHISLWYGGTKWTILPRARNGLTQALCTGNSVFSRLQEIKVMRPRTPSTPGAFCWILVSYHHFPLGELWSTGSI